MKTLRVHIADRISPDRPHYVSCVVDVPGLGQVELSDCVSASTIDNLFAEVEVAADLKLRGFVKPVAAPAPVQGGAQ